jgi:predicted alpha/beta hydrolase
MGDLEAGMAGYAGRVLALRMRDDWLGPAASLAWLLGKLPTARAECSVLGPDELRRPANHFGWMKAPEPVAARVAAWLEPA